MGFCLNDNRFYGIISVRENMCAYKRLNDNQKEEFGKYSKEFNELQQRDDWEDPKIKAVRDVIINICKALVHDCANTKNARMIASEERYKKAKKEAGIS